MSDIISGYSDYVRFILKSNNASSFILTSEPGGWRDDELELERNKKYHGIFTKFSNKLEFYDEAKDYIIKAYTLGGINTKLTLKNYFFRTGLKSVPPHFRHRAFPVKIF